MATPQTNLRVRISGDLADIKSGLLGLRKDLEGVKRSAREALRADNNQLVAGLKQARAQVAGLVAGFLSLRGVQGFARLADQAAVLNSRLKLATSSQQEFNKAYDETFRIAQRSRTSLEATVDLYARLERSTRDLGLNQDTLLALTETISQAAQLSGGGASADAALFQLSQGLASGQLRGEELNSVLEQTPRLAQAIADGLGVPIGALRELAKEGGLTAETLARALLNSRDQVAKEFAELPRGVTGALTQFKNSVLRIVEDVDRDAGITKLMIAGIEAAVPAIEGLGRFVQGLAKQFRDAEDAVRSFWNAFAAGGSDASIALEAVADNSGDLFGRFLAELQILPQSVRTIFMIILGESDKLGLRMKYYLRLTLSEASKAWEGMKVGFLLMAAKIREVFGEVTTFIGQQLQATTRRAAGLAQAAGFGSLAQKLQDAADSFGTLGDSAESARQDAAKAAAQYNAAVLSIEANVARFKQELDSGLEGANAAIDQALQEREAALASLASAAGEAREALDGIIVPGGGAPAAGAGKEDASAARKRAEAAAKVAKELQDVSIRLLELEGNTEAAAIVRLGAQFQDLRDRLLKEGNTLGVQLIDRVFNAELAEQRLDSIASRTSEALANLRSETDYLASQVELAGKSPIDAEQDLQKVRETTLKQLRALREEAQLAYNQAPSPATLAAVRQLDTEILQIAESQKKFKKAAEDSGFNALKGFFTDLATGAKSFKDAFKDAVVSFVQGIAQMIAQEWALYAVKMITRAFSGGFGGAASSAASAASGIGAGVVGVGTRHTGGLVGQGARRMISAAAYAHHWGKAPRLHNGGDLRGGEIATILQEGERVLSRQENAQYSAGAAGRRDRVTTPVVAIGEQAIADALAGAAGESIVLTHVRNNWGGLSRGDGA